MDLGGWLRSLGLERYEAAFRENEINERVLPSLTQEDLKEIGVGPVGHRRMLLEAIAALRADTSGKASSADAATTSAAPSVSHGHQPRARQSIPLENETRRSRPPSNAHQRARNPELARRAPNSLRCIVGARVVPNDHLSSTYTLAPPCLFPRCFLEGETQQRERTRSDVRVLAAM